MSPRIRPHYPPNKATLFMDSVIRSTCLYIMKAVGMIVVSNLVTWA
jgi:hypothetical protein